MDELFGKVGFILVLKSLQNFSETYLIRILTDFAKDAKITNIV
jgi:hypothetical protein